MWTPSRNNQTAHPTLFFAANLGSKDLGDPESGEHVLGDLRGRDASRKSGLTPSPRHTSASGEGTPKAHLASRGYSQLPLQCRATREQVCHARFQLEDPFFASTELLSQLAHRVAWFSNNSDSKSAWKNSPQGHPQAQCNPQKTSLWTQKRLPMLCLAFSRSLCLFSLVETMSNLFRRAGLLGEQKQTWMNNCNSVMFNCPCKNTVHAQVYFVTSV